MSQQNLSLNVSLEQTTPVVCEECSNETFTQVVFLREVSRFVIGTQRDGLTPIPSFACAKCGHVNEQFQLKNLHP
jgi:uncharacterized Zn finger protein